MWIYWQPSSVLFNHKIKEEMAVNLQAFQKKPKGKDSQVLVFWKQVILLLIFIFNKCFSSTAVPVHQYQIAWLQYVWWHLSIL